MAVNSGKKRKNIDKAKNVPPSKKKKTGQTVTKKATARKQLTKKSTTKKSVISKKKTVQPNKKLLKPMKVTSTKLKNVPKGSSKKTIKIHTKTQKSTKTISLSKKTPKARTSNKMSIKEVDGKNKKKVAMLKLTTKLAISKAKSAVDRTKIIKVKLDKAKALKAKSAAAKARKLKVAKSLSKLKNTIALQPAKFVKTKPTLKKQMIKTVEPKKTVIDKEGGKLSKENNAEKKGTESVKRKNIIETDDTPRKRRSVLPNKKYADFEIDVPSKRTIIASQKSTELNSNTTQKNVSELRAFIQDKKKPPLKSDEENKTILTPAMSGTNKATLGSKIKVIKPSEMKPAEKLLKKLQKKLEKEAKAVSSPQSLEKREKAKIKITKVVTYHKSTVSSEDVDEKPQEKVAFKTSKLKQLKQQKIALKSKVAIKAKPTPKSNLVLKKVNAVKQIKTTQKTPQAPEKIVKPKKIKELKREERPIQAHFVAKYNVKQPDDDNATSLCWITGMAVFPSGEVITVDMANRKIKLFNKEFGFLSQIKLDTIPQDISTSPVNASHAYFTQPFSKIGIQKICMCDGKITLSDAFLTNGTNRGIVCTKAGILTSVQDGRYHDLDINHFKIDLLDYEGNLIQSVSTDPTGSRLFKLPLYFTVDNTGKQIIVSDCIKNRSYIISVDMTGTIKFKYEGTNNNPITPRGLATDDENNIYVTEWEKNNVYVLSPNGKRLQVLFTQTELLEQGSECGMIKPYQLCVFKHDDKKALLLSEEGSNTIKLFHLFKKSENSVTAVPQSEAVPIDKTGVSAVEVKQDVSVENSKDEVDVIPAEQQIRAAKKSSSPTKVVKRKETAIKAKVLKSNRRQTKGKSEETAVENKTELSTGDEIDQTSPDEADAVIESTIIPQTQVITGDVADEKLTEKEADTQELAQNLLVQDATSKDANELQQNTIIAEENEVKEEAIVAEVGEVTEDAIVTEVNEVQEDAIVDEVNEVQEDAIIAQVHEVQEYAITADVNVQEDATVVHVNEVQEHATVADDNKSQEDATLTVINEMGIENEKFSVSQAVDEVQVQVNHSYDDIPDYAQTNELEYDKQSNEIPDFNQSETDVLTSAPENHSVTQYMQEVGNPAIEYVETVEQVEAMDTDIVPINIPLQSAAVENDEVDYQPSDMQTDDAITEISETETVSEEPAELENITAEYVV